jgi:hypothetical protein
VSFAVLGLLAAACGSGGSASVAAASSGSDQAPNNATDQAPSNGASDPAANTSTDQAPSSTDRPPSNPDAPAGSGGGNLGALCREFCTSLSDLANRCGTSNDSVDIKCDDSDCQVPANYPCVSEATELFTCFIDNLDQLCTSSNSGDNSGNGDTPAAQPQQTSICESALKATTDCTKAHGLNDTSNDPMSTPHNCTPQGGCEMCGTDCATCLCKAGNDTDKSTACFDTGGDCAQ